MPYNPHTLFQGSLRSKETHISHASASYQKVGYIDADLTEIRIKDTLNQKSIQEGSTTVPEKVTNQERHSQEDAIGIMYQKISSAVQMRVYFCGQITCG
jgi:signal transduction histidine kinase